MTTTRVAVPLFPNPPKEYSQRYMADVQRAFAQFVEALTNPGEGRNTFLVLTDLKNDDVGLEPGTLYKSGNSVMISTLDVAAVAGSGVTISAGTVEVTIT